MLLRNFIKLMSLYKVNVILLEPKTHVSVLYIGKHVFAKRKTFFVYLRQNKSKSIGLTCLNF